MREYTDTQEVDYTSGDYGTVVTPRRKPLHTRWWFWSLLIAAAGLVLVGVCFFQASPGYGMISARLFEGDSAVVRKEPVARPLSNAVILRWDGAEIFRFTYEGGRAGQNLSLEIVEGRP